MELNIPQTTALDFLEDNTSTEVLFGGAAGPGKSTLGCYWILKCALKYPGTRWVIGRSTLKTLKETTYVTFLKVAKMQGLINNLHFRMNNHNNVMTFGNGSEILWKDLFYYPADPDVDELGSLEITGAFIDEANQVNVSVKNVLRSRIRHMLDEHGLIPKALYTCNPGKNWTKSEFYTPAKNGTLGKTKRFVPASLEDNPHITKYYRENLLSLPKSLRDRLLHGNWDYSDDPSQLMTAEMIYAIFSNTFVKPTGKRYITADIARMGKDRTVIRVWDGWMVLKRVELQKVRITDTANKIAELADYYRIPMNHVLADEDGVGGGVVDILKCKGFIANATPVKIKNNDNFTSFKDQCGWYLANKINCAEVYEPCESEPLKESIVEELQQVKDATIDATGKRRLLSKQKIKEEIGRSPDDSDTMLMRAAFDLRVGGMSLVTGNEVVTENMRTI